VCSGATLEAWWRTAAKAQPALLQLTRDELMRHEAAGITTATYPRTVRLGGIDCTAEYLHEPGDARDGVTVTLPVYALNQASEARCEWLVPGLLPAKVQALCKTLHQRPRSRLVPLPGFAAEFCASVAFGEGSLMDALLAAVRERTQLGVQRADFKPDQLPPHLFMNLRVVDEHGRQLGMGRDLAGLKAALGAQARSAFQALAALKLPASAAVAGPAQPPPAGAGAKAAAQGGAGVGARAGASESAAGPASTVAEAASADAEPPRYTAWTFGDLPELMEIRRRGEVLVGFPALIDHGTHVGLEVFDEADAAAARHRAGLRRLVALQLREPLKFLERNIPDLTRMAAVYMPLGTLEELREQIIAVALDRAFLAEPLPGNAADFDARVAEGRTRLNLIAAEVARLAGTVLAEWAAAQRKLKDSRPPRELAEDLGAQLQRLVGRRFLLQTPWAALQHLPRYLKGVVLRLEKWRADPGRDAARLAELRPLEQRWMRRVAELRGAPHPRLDEYRWLLEELRVSLFAQELRTPQPVSAKRLDRLWAQIVG
jgi:ATP-dependent helicase HrpA